MKITLTEWAARRYSPAPSAWTLRRMVREGDIYPKPELLGRTYYVHENARRLSASDGPALSLVDRIKETA